MPQGCSGYIPPPSPAFWRGKPSRCLRKRGTSSVPTAIDTAYPRLKAHPTAKELDGCYTSTLFELSWAEKRARAAATFVG